MEGSEGYSSEELGPAISTRQSEAMENCLPYSGDEEEKAMRFSTKPCQMKRDLLFDYLVKTGKTQGCAVAAQGNPDDRNRGWAGVTICSTD